jgi:hypothetical protein
MLDSGSVEHLAADRAGRGKDQSQKNNLVEKPRRTASAVLGSSSIDDFHAASKLLFNNPSTGTDSIPRL